MSIGRIGQGQPGITPEPEGEQPDLSVGQGLQRAEGPKTAGEGAIEATSKLDVKTGEEVVVPKNWEPTAERISDVKLQGLLVRDHLQMTDAKRSLVAAKLPHTEAEAGAWEVKFRSEAGLVAGLGNKADADIHLPGGRQSTDPTRIKFDGSPDLMVQERLKHAGERVSQQSDKLAVEVDVKSDKDLLVRDKLKLANEGAATLSRSKSQVSGTEAGVWEAKLQGEGQSSAGIEGARRFKNLESLKEMGLIESESSGAQLDKDHKAFSVAENLSSVQSQNIWGERPVRHGDVGVQEKVDLSEDLRIVETKPPDIKG